MILYFSQSKDLRNSMGIEDKLPEFIKVYFMDLEINLVKVGNIHTGKNNLNHIKWFEYKLELPQELKGPIAVLENYDNIVLNYFKITSKCKEDAEKKCLYNHVSISDTPNIDMNTGNIHPTKEYVRDFREDEIRQIVLCNRDGPKLNLSLKDKEANLYSNITCEDIYVNKASYFPMIDESNDSCIMHDFMKTVWSELKKLGLAI